MTVTMSPKEPNVTDTRDMRPRVVDKSRQVPVACHTPFIQSVLQPRGLHVVFAQCGFLADECVVCNRTRAPSALLEHCAARGSPREVIGFGRTGGSTIVRGSGRGPRSKGGRCSMSTAPGERRCKRFVAKCSGLNNRYSLIHRIRKVRDQDPGKLGESMQQMTR